MIVNVINKSVKVSHKEQRLVLPIEALFGMVPVNLNFPSSKNANIHGDEAELASICQGDSKATSINIEGKEIKGKCALGFVAPKPRM